MTATERKERERLMKESMDLVLKRGGVTKKVLLEDAMHSFFNRNYKELLTPEEQRKYASVIL
ncbi:MAG: hypothetical protein J6P95_04635 [Paludibacteraceae bacterium]|jgi:hypothetical protein|nr:hypothetical protein [Paludibacteraceae bacterium]